MKLSDVKKLKECYSDEEANKYLDDNYEVLKIISSRNTTPDVEEVRPCYVLGKDREKKKHGENR